MTTTKSENAGIDETSGLAYFEEIGAAEGVEWKIEAIEGDSATLEATISVSSMAGLNEVIERLQALRLNMAHAERVRGEV